MLVFVVSETRVSDSVVSVVAILTCETVLSKSVVANLEVAIARWLLAGLLIITVLLWLLRFHWSNENVKKH